MRQNTNLAQLLETEEKLGGKTMVLKYAADIVNYSKAGVPLQKIYNCLARLEGEDRVVTYPAFSNAFRKLKKARELPDPDPEFLVKKPENRTQEPIRRPVENSRPPERTSDPAPAEEPESSDVAEPQDTEHRMRAASRKAAKGKRLNLPKSLSKPKQQPAAKKGNEKGAFIGDLM
ncbi:hypothetical protein [Citreimonas salinaria]|nr:hypothetical protein [Citreimonas salinaria]